MALYYVLLIVLISLIALFGLSALFYKQFFKRFYDIVLSALALIILSPLLLVLTIVGAIKMHGNPFFTQERPGKNEKIFKLIKFRSMDNRKDKDGNLLPDSERLSNYGRKLRSTSLDELPELYNILKGDMSIVGPRPLAVQYLPYYNETERHRHDVRPGLTGYAQVHGRNSVQWETRFKYDCEYSHEESMLMDIKIILLTIKTVIKRKNIGERGVDSLKDFDAYRRQQLVAKEEKQ